MKSVLTSRAGPLLLVVLAAMLAFAPGRPAQADTRVAVSFFYDELEPYGYWVEDEHYGTVWYPRRRAADWQPYVYGRWVWTADYGWYWDSEEDWGWATYHYGRWVHTDAYGWVWVPDDEWGPAWVEWRTGGGYVGWAPMPPEVAWREGVFVYAGVDLSTPRYQPCWVFVAEASFSRPDAWRYRVPRARTEAMLHASVRATDYRRVDARIVNRSVDVGRISAAAKVRISPEAVVISETHVRAGAGTHGRVAIYRPRLGARAGVGAGVGAGVRVEAPPLRAHVEAESGDDLPPFEGSRIGGSVGGGAATGIGGGIGIGGGGGLRIGR